MLSQTAEHALRAVLYLAQREGERPIPSDVIARALDAPANYLGKTLHVLAKLGMVESVRGRTGGFRLKQDPRTLPVSRIVAAFDDPRSGGACLMGGKPCNPANPCAAHDRWVSIQGRVREVLNETMVSDLLAPGDMVFTGSVGKAEVAAGHFA